MRTEKTEITVFLTKDEMETLNKAAILMETFSENVDFCDWFSKISGGNNPEDFAEEIYGITNNAKTDYD